VTTLTTVSDAEAAAARASSLLARLIIDAREKRGVAHVALAGGETPRRTYELLAEELEDWSGVELWFGDERCVSPDDPESNYLMVSESLLARANIDPGNVHRILGELGPEEAARRYAAELCDHVPRDENGTPVLDVVLLGLGPDGHTASLFPGGEELESQDIVVPVFRAPKPPPERVSLSLMVLRAARHCVMLATGPSKADAVAALIAGPDRHVPASLLRTGRLELIVDDAASPPAPPSE
jgi:6-phosphogluconolactonase